MITIHLQGPLGEQLDVTVAHPDQILPTLRQYARRGYSSGTLPTGGLAQRLDAEHDFPWDVIGARAYVLPDGTPAVHYRGRTYRRREQQHGDLHVVAYSRGANRHDDPLAVTLDGPIKRVDLVRFVGRIMVRTAGRAA